MENIDAVSSMVDKGLALNYPLGWTLFCPVTVLKGHKVTTNFDARI